MALSFPLNPQIGDTYTAPNGYLYTWDGTKWYVTSGGTGGGGGGAGSLTIQQGGVNVNTSATTLNFTGTTFTLTSRSSVVDIYSNPATTSTLGSVIAGENVMIDANGVISVHAGLLNWGENYTIIDNTLTAVVSLYVMPQAQADIDAAIIAQGAGATIASATGNKRGEYATDWQKQIGDNSEVASGAYSVISGGSFNKASGQASIVIGGNNNLANSDYSTILGGQGGTARGIIGAQVTPGFASGGIYAAPGAMQTAVYVLGAVSNDTTAVRLTTDGGPSITVNNQIAAGDRSTVQFKGTVVARVNAEASESAYWSFEGMMKQDIDSTSTDFVPAGTVPVVTLVTATSTLTNNWTVSVEINNLLGCMSIVASGDLGQQVRWVSKVETIEITDAV
jgi:hypothetical protein